MLKKACLISILCLLSFGARANTLIASRDILVADGKYMSHILLAEGQVNPDSDEYNYIDCALRFSVEAPDRTIRQGVQFIAHIPTESTASKLSEEEIIEEIEKSSAYLRIGDLSSLMRGLPRERLISSLRALNLGFRDVPYFKIVGTLEGSNGIKYTLSCNSESALFTSAELMSALKHFGVIKPAP